LWIIFTALILSPCVSFAEDGRETLLVHLKTSLKKDDAQICVAYNVIWAALRDGMDVKVLVDANAVYTYRTGWRGKDDIEDYKLPESLRRNLSGQFRIPEVSIPRTYGEYLALLKQKGAEFYINTGMLIVSKTGTPEDPLKNISAKFFKPVTLTDILRLRRKATSYIVY
jgi:hypothetical protein